jgi:hypothetical protein
MKAEDYLLDAATETQLRNVLARVLTDRKFKEKEIVALFRWEAEATARGDFDSRLADIQIDSRIARY